MFARIYRNLNMDKVKRVPSQDRNGQSLVEMAIATPLLILLFLGVFEVGWAIRGYLVLANMNRETTRFAVKTGVLDFSEKDANTVGYGIVMSHTIASLAAQLPLDFGIGSANSTIIMSHYFIDTRLPCAKYQGANLVVPYEFDPNNCDCSVDDPNHAQWFDKDDLIAYPNHPNFPHYLQTYGISRTSRFGGGNFQAIADELTLHNNQLNCTVLKTGTAAEISTDNVFVSEVFYEQAQLLGVPLISNPLTDPIPMYGHTVMRIVISRDADTTDSVGPACEVYPITFHEDALGPNPVPGTPVDAFEGGGDGNFGWMNWDPGDNSNTYIIEELINPRLSVNDFIGLTPPAGLDPDPSNDSLNLGDWVSGKTGVGNSDGVMDELEALAGLTIRIPIYDNHAGTGSNKGYHVSHLALITITEVCLPRNSCPGVSGNDKQIKATFVGYDDEACMG
jgi:hypothetical protein